MFHKFVDLYSLSDFTSYVTPELNTEFLSFKDPKGEEKQKSVIMDRYVTLHVKHLCNLHFCVL
jgi:hypothetical protein